jgi:hypothetical protein
MELSQQRPLSPPTFSVWLFTRPLSYASLFPPMELTSDGSDSLRHWGVVVTELTLIDVQVILQRTKGDMEDDDTSLGTLYELRRDEKVNNVNIVRPFKIATVRREWRAFSCQHIGQTKMTHDMIEHEGIS